ncbi:MAG TPA: hypothetical protein VF432_28530 [Thermoanaerobaculia bacterium]
MSVPILAVTVFLAAIFPGPERLVTPPSFGGAYRGQIPKDLASDGTGFLALSIGPVNGQNGLYAVAIRERAAGQPLPPRRIARGDISHAYAVWAGDAYLVVWSDTTTRQLFAARLSRDAEPIGEPAVIGEGLYVTGLAWNGRSALAVVTADDWRRLVLSLAGDGTVERTTTLPIERGVGSTITVAAAGDTFVVTWIETIASTTAPPVSALRAMRFDGRGVSLDATPAALPLAGDLRNGARSVSADSDGERVGLAFVARPEEGAGPPWWDTLRTFTIDVPTMAITETASRAVVSDADVVATTRGFLAATQTWKDEQTVLVLTPFDGSAATEMMIPRASQFLLTRSTGAVMAVWTDFDWQLSGVALDEAGTRAIGQAGPVALPAMAQVDPILAPAGDQALVLWIDLLRPRYGNVMAMRVDGDGNALDAPFAVGTGVNGGGDQTPAAVFTGQVWLVTWSSPNQPGLTFICRVSTDGLVFGCDNLFATSYALASNGSVSVLASGGPDGISITRFSPAGAWLDTMDVGAPARAGSDAQLATNGREFLLVWTEASSRQLPSPDSRDVMAVRLDAGGMVLGSPIAVANGTLDEGEPVVAGSDGGDFLVLYSLDKRTVRAKRVSREGVAGDEMLVANDPLPLAVTRARSGYVAAFANGYESGTALISTVHLDRSGVPMGPPALISRSEAPWREMSLGVLNGSPVAVYSRSVAGPPFEDVPRLFMRTLTESMRRRSVR